MKRRTLKLFALLLATVMVMALIPTAALADGRIIGGGGRTDLSGDTQTPRPNGYIHEDIPGGRAVSEAYARGDMETYYRLKGVEAKRDTLPSSYNSNTLGYVTSVKDQNPYGSCWAHAAMASVESYMIKHGVPVGTGSAATTSLNLSETQHCFFNYSSAYDAEGMLTGDKCTLTGSDSCLDTGGNGEMSAYTLQRWCGAASESVSALAYSKAGTVARSGLASTYSYNNNICHVQNSEWIPGTDIEGIKRAIMEYGAGNISYYETGSAYTYICTKDTSSQSSSSHKWANHAITIVGWDDSISKSSGFKPNTPSSNGAWICKNSWGTSYFSQGYCYISYEDTSVLEGYIYFYDAEPIDNYDHNYQYDGSCNVVCYGKGWPSSEDYYVGFANNTKVANVFTATGSQMLEAVALCNWDEALSYTVEIYKNPTTGNPSSGTLMTSQSGSLTYSGYYTIVLDTPVLLAEGDTFSVVFTQSCPTADDSGKYIHTPYDASFNNSDYVDWATWTHTNHGNTSYYKEPNGSWKDCPDNGDYRIKAYTSDYENTYTVTAVSNNTSYGTVSVTGTVITATPKTGYYVESATVISGTATVSVNGNTITVSPESDCTVRVNFAPKPTYTVNFVAAGNAEGNQTAYLNDAITLPNSVSVNPDGWTFIGWVAAELAETTDAPTYYAPGASYTVTGNTTLYAVYSRVEEGGGDLMYQLTDELAVGGKYAITINAYAVGNTVYTTSNNHYVTAQSVTIDSSTETLTVPSGINVNTILYEVESGSTSAGWVFKNVANGKYLSLTSDEYATVSSSPLAWLYSSHDLNNQVDSEGYYYLSLGSTNAYFTTSKSATTSVYLYREVNSAVTYYTTDPVVAVHEHTMNRVAPVEPTCTVEGNIEYWVCTGCGKYFSDAAGNNEIALTDTVIAALGHNYVATVTPPTCTEQGCTTHTCSRCGDTYVDTYVPALGHSYNGWTSNNNGTHSHTCSACGDVVTENCTYNDVVTPPTATEQGYTTHTCTVCGYSFTDSYTEPLGVYFTVHFSVPSGVTALADMYCREGQSITLPSAGAPAGYTFLGWVTEDVNNATELPTVLTGSYAATADITLIALYSHVKTTAGGYALVTEAPDTWEGSYVITYGKTSDAYVLKGLSGTKKYEAATAGGSVALSTTGMTIDGDRLSGVTDIYVFTVSASNGKLAIRNTQTGTYLANKGSYLYSYKSFTKSYCLWSLAMSEETVDATNTSSKSRPHLTFSTAKNYFMVNSSTADIFFWKMSGATESTVYTTVID